MSLDSKRKRATMFWVGVLFALSSNNNYDGLAQAFQSATQSTRNRMQSQISAPLSLASSSAKNDGNSDESNANSISESEAIIANEISSAQAQKAAAELEEKEAFKRKIINIELSASGEEYSTSLLTPKQMKEQWRREKDSYSVLDDDALPRWIRVLYKPFRAASRRFSSKSNRKPGTLTLIKCGESEMKKELTFTGWLDPDLTEQGISECEHAARLLIENGYDKPDIVYTSVLKRAIHSVWALNQELDSAYLPVYKSWRLNERMYGALQGLSKSAVAEHFGSRVVQAWRRSLKARPPAAKPNDENDPLKDRRYADIPKEFIPYSESLEDCMDRARPLWQYQIKRHIKDGNDVVVVAHSNSLRGLVKIIDDIGDDEIEEVRFPPGIPFVYKFDSKLNPIEPEGDLKQVHTSGMFLEKPGLLKEAINRQKEWSKFVPGTDTKQTDINKRMSNMEQSLLRLKQEKIMGKKWAQENVEQHEEIVNGQTAVKLEKEIESNNINEFYDDFDVDVDIEFEQAMIDEKEKEAKKTSSNVVPNVGQVDVQKDPVVVLVRHGTTPHNQLALFTGWEDPELAPKGVDDARRAGQLLKKHGFEFDVVYTSWLTRAIQTAWYIMDELDMQWLPLIKSWRLNERHYGALTGKSKKMVGNIYGQEQLIKWRRGYDIPPPQVSSYSFAYPGNDYKRTKHVKDLRISFTETVCRSIEARKLQIHRKFPKAESLKMCMDRSIPYYTEKIVPEAVSKGKRVLITSHENAIRGILMHLCEIPEEHMNGLHLPNGLPLVYNVRRKCISLLDDGSGKDPLELYDFGSAAEFLFRPCELVDEDFIFDNEKQEKSNSDDTPITKNEEATIEKEVVMQ